MRTHPPIFPLGAAALLASLSAIVGVSVAQAQVPRANDKPPAAERRAVAKQAATIRGACHDQDARPVAGARIRLFEHPSATAAAKLVAQTTSDAEGRFAFADVSERDDFAERGFVALATAAGHVSRQVSLREPEGAVDFVMSTRTGTLSGVVQDPFGNPLAGVAVFESWFGEPVAGFRSALTDQAGRFAIADLHRWTPEDEARADKKPRGAFLRAGSSIQLWRADFAFTRGRYSNVPEQVRFTLPPPGIVEGRVRDEVTGKPLAGAAVHAQGIATSDVVNTRAAEDGGYRLLLNEDHYDIWADAADRVAVELKAVDVEQGAAIKDANIRMVRGGVVWGIVRDVESDRPIHVTKGDYCVVEAFGPGRSRSRTVSNAVHVSPEGAYRIRVAPGRNYLSFGHGAATDYVEVADGQELNFDLEFARRVDRNLRHDDDPELRLQTKLRREAREAAPAPRIEAAPTKRVGQAGNPPAEAIASWGTLKGRFVVEGAPPPKPAKLVADPSLVIGPKGELANALVWVRDENVRVHPEYEKSAKDNVVLEIGESAFEPHIVALRTGQTLLVRNSGRFACDIKGDLIRNSTFNHVVQPGAEWTKSGPFVEEPMPLPISCGIRPIRAMILIRGNPYAAVSTFDGAFELRDLPAGQPIELQFWQETAGYLRAIKIGDTTTDVRGRVKLTINPGENDLGEIRVPAKAL